MTEEKDTVFLVQAGKYDKEVKAVKSTKEKALKVKAKLLVKTGVPSPIMIVKWEVDGGLKDVVD